MDDQTFDFQVSRDIGGKFCLPSYPLAYLQYSRGPGVPERVAAPGINTRAIIGGKLCLLLLCQVQLTG